MLQTLRVGSLRNSYLNEIYQNFLVDNAEEDKARNN